MIFKWPHGFEHRPMQGPVWAHLPAHAPLFGTFRVSCHADAHFSVFVWQFPWPIDIEPGDSVTFYGARRWYSRFFEALGARPLTKWKAGPWLND